MRSPTLILLAITALAGFPLQAKADTINLGTAGNFAVLAGQTVTNTGATTITGDVGVHPGSAITGFGTVTLVPPSAIHAADAVALQAKSDLVTAYNDAAGRAVTTDFTATPTLGGRTLTPGVYHFNEAADLTGVLTLNNLGDANALFVFQIGSTLTTASSSSVVTLNGDDCNVFWQVGSSATLGTTTNFEGHILALTSITMNNGATIFDGSALARNGAVTLDSNTITNCNEADIISATAAPLPGTATMGLVLLPLAWLARRFAGVRVA